MAEKMIALVFTDLVNSTAIKNHLTGSNTHERNETYRDTILLPHRQRVTASLSQYQGRIVTEMGDGFFLVFPNAVLAAEWAVGMQTLHINEPIPTPLGNLEVKVGMHIGSPLEHGEQFIGQEVDYAARVADLATGEQILLSENAAAFMRSAQVMGLNIYAHGEMYLRGIGFAAVPIFELLYADRPPRPLKGATQPRSREFDPIYPQEPPSGRTLEPSGRKPSSQQDDINPSRQTRLIPVDPALPASAEVNLEFPDGQVPIDSRFYIPSAAEERCYEEIKKPGSLIRIKSPHQMGKSSLMIRVLAQAKQLGYRTVTLNLEGADQKFFKDIDAFLKWFCAMVGKQLGFKLKTEAYWDDIFGANDNTTEYFENYPLHGHQPPLVLAIDNFDRIFKYADIETDFCGLLRGWYGRSRNDALWGNLRLIIVHSQEPYLPKDINQSPFNVGLPIVLGELTAPEVQELIMRHGLVWTEAEVEEFGTLIGGHPYLVRLALFCLATGDLSLEEFLQTAPTEEGIYRNHLLGHLKALEDYPDLAAAMKTVVSSAVPVQLRSEEAFKLDSRGLIVRNKNKVQPRCLLYRLYFCDRLGV
jgi:class 3 adenylate cyclase